MTQKSKQTKKKNNQSLIFLGIIIIAIAVGFYFVNMGTEDKASAGSTPGEGIKIKKSDIATKAKFYPYKVGETDMEVFAVKASDGTIRTALNTCQVCYDSGAGYYKQEGEFLVCQNCGNRFHVDQVGEVRGGCNPIPIDQAGIRDAGENLEISNDYLASQIDYFSEWKTR